MDDISYFSIIIPTFNRAGLLRRAIQSVLDQQHTKFEIIVVDDGSSDNTEEIVSTFSDTRVRYIKKTNEERSIARNTGIDISTGSYVSFLDSDDYLYPNHFTEARKSIIKEGNPEVFHLNYECVYGQNKNTRPTLPNRVNDLVLADNRLSCNGVFIRRDIALQHKFIHHRRATYAEDTELWIRLAARYVFHHIPVVTSAIEMHLERSAYTVKPGSLLKSTLLIRRNLLQDQAVIRYYGMKRIEKFLAGRFLLTAVVFSTENKSWALSLLRRSLRLDWTMPRKKSFWVIIRNVTFK
ncbi:MAG: glycosyltransferase [Cyclobacteriaceae bacterium]|nr:glycosyltransferase [Cyclobacteriaceae bacterium]